MGKFIRVLHSALRSRPVDCFVDIVFAFVVLIEVMGCVTAGYSWIYEPMAAAPGARDGLGLLIVLPVVMGGSLVVAFGLMKLTKVLFEMVMPRWSPVLFH